ncbi:MAG: hypothetical protein F3745_08830 [Nitrospinae bacterium]|nr:hypothetical protein [Nitrospinota bacterium]
MILFQKNNWNFYLIAFLYALAFNEFALITADNDLWGHIKFGQDIWTQNSLPVTNNYSYTAPDHPWNNHEWLAEIIFYLTFSFFGSTGLLAFKLLLGFYLIHLIYAHNLRNGVNPWLFTGVMILTIKALAPAFMVRPHLWTLLFFTIFILLLHKGLEGKPVLLYWIPLVMLTWVNCHGGVVAGLAVYTTVTLTAGAQFILAGDKTWKPLLASFLCSCLAVLINPYGIKLWEFFYHSLSQPRNITEWNSIPLLTAQFLHLKILVLLFLVTLFLPGKKPLWKMIVIVASIYFGFKHQRHSVLTAIVLALYLPVFLSNLLTNNKLNLFKAGYLTTPAKLTLSIFIVLQLMDGYSKYSHNHFKILVEPQVYPSYLAQFMKANQFKGNILVPFDWGEYLIWQLPDSKVSIDGRFRTAYPESVIRWNNNVYAVPDPKILERYPNDFIVQRKKDTPENYLKGNDNWKKIYEDIIAILFVRKDNDSVLQKFEKNQLNQPTEPPTMSFP